MTARLQGIPNSPFTIRSAQSHRESGLLGCGVTTLIRDRISAYVHYDAEVQEGGTAHAVTAGVRINF